VPRRRAGHLASTRSYRRIHPGAVHETILALEARIAAYFPQSGLRKVARELIEVSGDTTSRIVRIRRRSTAVRVVAWILCLAIAVILLTIPFTLRPGKVETLADAVQILEAALSASFFIGACVLFLLTWESRMRHQRTMEAIHELRAMAHVVDMHQLTKDPPMLLGMDGATALAPAPARTCEGTAAPEVSQPVVTPVALAAVTRTYTPFELQRYLDYCTEMLALISKVAVLYAQDTTDAATIAVIDEIEELTNGLSRKIWQKIVLIQRGAAGLSVPPSLEPARIPPQTVATS
jgi:hypothetical protein